MTFATDTEQGAAKLDKNVIEANLEAIQLTPRSHRHIDVGEPGEVRGREREAESMSARADIVDIETSRRVRGVRLHARNQGMKKR